MSQHIGVIYVAAVGFTALVAQAATSESPPYIIVVISLFAPVLPVLIGYVLTQRKLKRQDAKVQEIHVLVNSRLSKTLDALQNALVENIKLKNQLGMPVSPTEREAVEHVKDLGEVPEIDLGGGER